LSEIATARASKTCLKASPGQLNYNERMSQGSAGIGFAEIVTNIIAGFVTSIIAILLWELNLRFRAYKAACKLVGTWVAYKIHDRNIDTTPMQGAGLTVVSLTRFIREGAERGV